jgi:hypothetical protein
MKIETKIELTEKELAKVLAEHFDLDKDAKLEIYKYKADFNDPREQSYTKITLTGKKK